MSQYFDKDFFKFSIGFATIISVSLIIILATRMYEENSIVNPNEETASAIKYLDETNESR